MYHLFMRGIEAAIDILRIMRSIEFSLDARIFLLSGRSVDEA